MKDKAGKMNGNLVWLFALVAIGLGVLSSYLTAGMSSKVSYAVYFGIFAVCGFLAVFLTRAKTGIAVLAFILASIASGVIYFFIAKGLVADATTALTLGANPDAASAAGGVLGSAFGIFAAVIILADSLVAGIAGLIAGAKSRKKILQG